MNNKYFFKKPSIVIDDGIIGLNEAFVDAAAVGSNDTDAYQFTPFGRVTHLTIERVDAVIAVGRRHRRVGLRADEVVQRLLVGRVADVVSGLAAARRRRTAVAARVTRSARTRVRLSEVVRTLFYPFERKLNSLKKLYH